MAWLSGWTYRKQVTITGETGAGTNYQVLLKVGESSGAAGCDFHVENHSDSFPSDIGISGDIRFTDDDETSLLYFWVERVTGTTPNRIAYCWVNVLDSLETNVNIFCYYKGTTSNVSDGFNTFLNFDDFDDGSINAQWTQENSSAPNAISESARSGYVRLSTTTPGVTIDWWTSTFNAPALKLTPAVTDNFEMITVLDANPTVNYRKAGFGLVNNSANSTFVRIVRQYSTFGGGNNKLVSQYDSTELSSTAETATTDIFLKIRKVGTTYSFFYRTSISAAWIAMSTRVETIANLRVRLFEAPSSTDSFSADFNYFLLKKFIATEPAFNTSGSEATEPIQQTINSDVVFQIAGLQQSINSDVKFKALANQENINSDVQFTSSEQQTIDSDVKFKAIAEQQYIDSDVKFKAQIQDNINSDVTFIATNQNTIDSDVKFVIPVIYDFNSIVNFSKPVLSNINNSISFAKRILANINNLITTCKGTISNITNDFRTRGLGLKNINNDIRFLKSFQVPGPVGFQSLGKTYIHVYFNSVEQTDIDVDSIEIHKVINGSHTASFDLARAYDATKPAIETVVTIYYSSWLLYTGYITEINPDENPEKINIVCNNKTWKDNRSNVYFYVGHQSVNLMTQEKYYNTVLDAIIAEYSWNPEIGNIIPERMDLFAQNKSDVLTQLITNCGNFGWYYDELENYRLWRAGEGSVINITRQSLGENLRLHHLIRHAFKEDATGIINKYRVQMGDKTLSWVGYNYSHFEGVATPAWDSFRETLAKDSQSGFGWDNPAPGDEYLFTDVFKKFDLPGLDSNTASWTDRYPPRVEILPPLGFGISNNLSTFNMGEMTEGFTIDYENKTITFDQPLVLYALNNNYDGDPEHSPLIDKAFAPIVRVHIFKKEQYTRTLTPFSNPETEISNPSMFFTPKVGSYPTTIMKELDLSNMSIQHAIPKFPGQMGTSVQYLYTWDDSDYAMDLALWKLSNTKEIKITGNIEITLDTVCFYGVDLTKRIFISGITDAPMNITAIDINLRDFIVNVQLENSQSYQRSVSLEYHGD